MEHVGEQTFSKAFEPLINNIMMRKAKDYGLKKNTVTGLLRHVGNLSVEKKKSTIFDDKMGNEKTKFGSNAHFDRIQIKYPPIYDRASLVYNHRGMSLDGSQSYIMSKPA